MSLVAEADFGLSLLREASLNQTTVLSPISVALALSLVHLGAKGTSKEQVKNVLCKGTNYDDCASYFSSLQKTLEQKDHPYLKNWKYCSKPGNISCVPENMRQNYKPEQVPADFPLKFTGVLMNIANRMFASDDIAVKEAYQKELASKYDASLQIIDYKKADKAAEIVNDFVRNETAGKIDKLVGPDSFQNGKLALLVNAVYFHGRWAKKFAELMNKKEKFWEKDGVFKEATFMNLPMESFPFLDTGDFLVLALPYQERKYRLTLLLPKQRFGLAHALKKLNGEKLTELITNDKETNVNVLLPKFKIDFEITLENVLQKIGIVDPFTDRADLSGISDSPLKVGKVKHKVTIDVNEEGTTAAASTAIELAGRSGGFNNDEPIDFVADHPFLFVLSREGHVLFTGQYYG